VGHLKNDMQGEKQKKGKAPLEIASPGSGKGKSRPVLVRGKNGFGRTKQFPEEKIGRRETPSGGGKKKSAHLPEIPSERPNNPGSDDEEATRKRKCRRGKKPKKKEDLRATMGEKKKPIRQVTKNPNIAHKKGKSSKNSSIKKGAGD